MYSSKRDEKEKKKRTITLQVRVLCTRQTVSNQSFNSARVQHGQIDPFIVSSSHYFNLLNIHALFTVVSLVKQTEIVYSSQKVLATNGVPAFILIYVAFYIV